MTIQRVTHTSIMCKIVKSLAYIILLKEVWEFRILENALSFTTLAPPTPLTKRLSSHYFGCGTFETFSIRSFLAATEFTPTILLKKPKCINTFICLRPKAWKINLFLRWKNKHFSEEKLKVCCFCENKRCSNITIQKPNY